MDNKLNENKKILLVINPNAGKTKPMSMLSDILDVFTKSGFETIALSTKRKNDATDIVKNNGNDCNIVVCCGGDGTLNEVINGVMCLEKTIPIGYIPTGTSNDFATSLGLSTDYTEAAKDIVGGKLLAHDIGSFNGERYFNYVASFGTVSDVSYLTSQKAKNIFGQSAYIIEGFKALFKMRSFHATVEYDGQIIEDDFILGGASNSKSIGGVIRLKSEEISMNDGIFELIFFRKPRHPADVSRIASWMFKQNKDNESVIYTHAASVRITSEEYIPWTVDGEFEGYNKEVQIEAVHGSINFVCP